MFILALQVEYYPPKTEGADSDPDDSSDDSADEDTKGRAAKPRKHTHQKISPALAVLGHYARSMKPSKTWLTECQSRLCILMLFSHGL
jgi:phosphatidylinositol phospholipase C delta